VWRVVVVRESVMVLVCLAGAESKALSRVVLS